MTEKRSWLIIDDCVEPAADPELEREQLRKWAAKTRSARGSKTGRVLRVCARHVAVLARTVWWALFKAFPEFKDDPKDRP